MAAFNKLRAAALIIGCSSLSACGQPEVIHSTPPAEWTQPVPEPEVPEEATDEAVADYLVRLFDAFTEANNRLRRLDDWRAGVED